LDESPTLASLVVLSASLGPDELIGALGPADRTWALGDPHPSPSTGRNRFNGWEIGSTVDRSAPPGDHVRDLVERLRPLIPAITKLRASGSLDHVRFWLYLDHSSDAFSISPEDLAAIGEVGSFDVHIWR